MSLEVVGHSPLRQSEPLNAVPTDVRRQRRIRHFSLVFLGLVALALPLPSGPPGFSLGARFGSRSVQAPQVPSRTLAQVLASAEALVREGGESNLRQAETLYQQGLKLAKVVGDSGVEADCWNALGDIRRSLGDLQGSLVAFQSATDRFRVLGDKEREVETLNSQGRVLRLEGNLVKARQSYDKALLLADKAHFLPGKAVALNNLGMLWFYRGDIDLALQNLRRALEIWLELGRASRAATTLGNIGSAYLLGGRVEEAEEFLRQSLQLGRSSHDRNVEATALTELGWCRYLKEDYLRAIDLLEEAVNIRRATGDQLGEAGALDRLGSTLRELRRFPEAREAYEKSLRILRVAKSRFGLAHTTTNICELQLAMQDLASARSTCKRALDLFRETGDLNGEAHALHLKAVLAAKEGHLEEAVHLSEKAINLVDELWLHAEGRALRTSYLATRQRYFETLVTLLMDLHRRSPTAGYDARAFEASERARSRNLLEALLDSSFAESTAAPTGKESEVLEHELLGSDDNLALRRADHARSLIEALSRGRSLHLAEVQRALLDSQTLLLVFTVTEHESYLWKVSHDRIESVVLPGREALEKLVKKVRTGMTSPRVDPRRAFLELDYVSEVLFGRDATATPGLQKLVVVPDGPLYLLPFGALSARALTGRSRETGASGLASWKPIAARYQVVTLPSLSILSLLREPGAESQRMLAIFGDPVFSPDDSRVTRRTVEPVLSHRRGGAGETTESQDDLRRSAADLGLKRWQRLPGSRAEVLSIASTVAPKDRFVAVDFAASRDVALSGMLADFRIIHFATHALLHDRHPELSGIVLSLVDAAGNPVDGFLRVSDVLTLRLSADLVVLSGCRTGLGHAVRGEGLQGLSQAFLVAGARNLLVSLWDVNDKATAELMKRFYHYLLEENLPPSAALQATQASLFAEKRFKSPYYWAAFVLQGLGEARISSADSLNISRRNGSPLSETRRTSPRRGISGGPHKAVGLSRRELWKKNPSPK